MSETKNIIIGAGISGLSCAYVLKDCLVLEKEPHMGGLCRTIDFKGLRFDLGGHRIFSASRNIENTFKKLLKNEIVEFKRKSKIWQKGRFIDYPLQTSVIFDIPPWQTAYSFFTYLYRRIFPLKGNSFKDKAINRFGDNLYKLFLEEYTQKIWGLNCTNISEDLANTRLQNVSLKNAIAHMLGKKNNVKSFNETVIYPKKGIFQVIEAIAKDTNVSLNSAVTGIVQYKDKIEKVVVNNNQEINCKSLVSTMPITQLIQMLNAPQEIRQIAGGLKYRSMIFAFLILKRKNFTNDHWIYFPDGQVFGRIHEPKNWSSYMSPEEKTGICVEIFCDVTDKIWKMSDKEIACQVIRDLPFVKRFEIEDYCLERREYAYPVYGLNYNSKVDKLRQYLASYKNLFLLGRMGSFKYMNMDACLEEGMKLGNFIKASP